MTDSDRKFGSIVRLVEDRAFGFIYCPVDERDYFFHQAQLENISFRKLERGDVMSFIVAQGTRGVEAQDVRFERHDPPQKPAPAPGAPQPSARPPQRRK